ncbi:MAG: damage-control phosphatase ARMT1 family protein [bacterium]
MKLPPPLMTSEAGSFAQMTIIKRKPEIIKNILRDNLYPDEIVRSLLGFEEEIVRGRIQPLKESAPDVPLWNGEWKKYEGRGWLELPWYFAESFFYRRVLEATRYFQDGETEGKDPFEAQKLSQIKGPESILPAFSQMLSKAEEMAEVEESKVFFALLHYSLWGNQVDLSNPDVTMEAGREMVSSGRLGRVIIDDTERVHCLFRSGSLKRLDFINDNSGLEILSDLRLADFVLSRGWVERVQFNLKKHPFFVSDAMVKDVLVTVSKLNEEGDPRMEELGERISDYIDDGRLILRDDPFWNTFLMFDEMTSEVERDLSESDLVILKGDVNYRRLLMDRHWPPTTLVEEVASYFPTSFLILRTLKGEIIAGLKEGEAESLAVEDPQWLLNGKRGIVQLVEKSARGERS